MANQNTYLQELLTPTNSVLLLIDHQPQMTFGVQSIDRQLLKSNTVGLAKAAKAFKVPTILTTVAAKTFSGALWPELQAVFPAYLPLDRTTMNAWEDEAVVEAVKKTERKKIIMAALWTEVCLAFPAICAVKSGYEVYAVYDASGGTSVDAHEMAFERMIQQGIKPLTWLQVLLEFQRDWARTDTYNEVMKIVIEHAGAYGVGVQYAQGLLGGHK
jgi:nicotinamidase-related amidase